MSHLRELKTSELKKVNGGYTFLEYCAYGLGYAAKKFVMGVPETSPSMGRL